MLGLAELEDTAALARQIDANVLFREGETSRVSAWPQAIEHFRKDHFAYGMSQGMAAQGIPTCTPRAVIFDLSGSLGGALTPSHL